VCMCACVCVCARVCVHIYDKYSICVEPIIPIFIYSYIHMYFVLLQWISIFVYIHIYNVHIFIHTYVLCVAAMDLYFRNTRNTHTRSH